MSTRRSLLLFVYMRISWFRLPIILPLRVVWECIDAAEDLLLLTGKRIAGKDIGKILQAVSDAVRMVTSLGSFDLVEVEAHDRVSIKIGLW